MTEQTALEKLLEEQEYTVDDLLKIICSMTSRMMREESTDTADITETIYGSGLKFTINLKAEPNDRE